jgi:hypothetical protein
MYCSMLSIQVPVHDSRMYFGTLKNTFIIHLIVTVYCMIHIKER